MAGCRERRRGGLVRVGCGAWCEEEGGAETLDFDYFSSSNSAWKPACWKYSSVVNASIKP